MPLAQTGRHRKKAVVVISDGNDTNSRATMRELKQEIRESEVLIYAIGIDSQAVATRGGAPPGSYPPGPGPRMPVPLPFPSPGGGRRVPQPPARTPPPMPPAGGSVRGSRLDDRVNVATLRDITDDSGGRTEIVRTGRDLDPATASVADELSKQYYLGYPSPGKRDGRWHTIRVELRAGDHLVRARRGYVATP